MAAPPGPSGPCTDATASTSRSARRPARAETSNILYSNKGEVKICDFGLARQYGEPLRAYTPVVVTLWYRAPELLLGADHYSTPIDVFSLGCVMAELLQGKTLFNGKGELEQLGQMVDLLGSPTERDWPTRGRKGEPGYVPGILDLPGLTGAGTGARLRHQPHFRLREKFPKHSFHGGPTLSDAGFDLLESMLRWDPLARPTAAEVRERPARTRAGAGGPAWAAPAAQPLATSLSRARADRALLPRPPRRCATRGFRRRRSRRTRRSCRRSRASTSAATARPPPTRPPRTSTRRERGAEHVYTPNPLL